ncbi:hypothetical protein PR048_022606 [Dryococelus australis]|uniref:Uncharacterized protein n=1 Tax=Dryococelus australis TaxID=614101 RepID=A0ABQ9H1J9_9NEOP|nr:hypothetical protein PR048_022606 [Dryococelus australis]
MGIVWLLLYWLGCKWVTGLYLKGLMALGWMKRDSAAVAGVVLKVGGVQSGRLSTPARRITENLATRPVWSRHYPLQGAAVAERLDCSPPTTATPGFSHVGIMPDDESGRRVLSGISRFHPCIPALLHSHLISPHRLLRPRVGSRANRIHSAARRSQSDVSRVSRSQSETAYDNVQAVTSHFSEDLLKFYFQDIPPPRADKA